MPTRRFFLQLSALAAGGFVAGCRPSDPVRSEKSALFCMPEEGDPHRRTWMAFRASTETWGADLVDRVEQDLGLIARTIARFEPVSMLISGTEHERARTLVGHDVELVQREIDDLWMRDTGPLFVHRNDGSLAGVDLNFNGWGGKQRHEHDAEVAPFVIDQVKVDHIETDLVLEGGCIEVDGQGTAIIAESCVLNDNRNPGVSKEAFTREISLLLGLEKIIWIPGIAGTDITDGHTDFYARFAGPGVVVVGYDPDPASSDHLVTREHEKILRRATDAAGRSLEVHRLEAPMMVREEFETEDFAAGYIGYYVCNGAVLLQQFGDPTADEAARATIAGLFPDREIVVLDVDGIAAGGGSIHCTTQQEPMPRKG